MAGEELNSAKVEIIIDGKECDFLKLDLYQTPFGHHIFSIELNYRIRKQDVWTHTPDQILKQLGTEVSIRISDRVGNTTEFKGIIKKINIGGKHSDHGVVTLYSGSPTLRTTDDYKIEPAYNDTIPFVYRYKANLLMELIGKEFPTFASASDVVRDMTKNSIGGTLWA